MGKNNKREAIETGIRQMDAEQKELARKRELNDPEIKKDNARPYLIKRIGVALLDFVFMVLFAGGLFALSYFAIFPSLEYNNASETIITYHQDCHLFIEANGKYESITDNYNEDVTPEENYDVPISYYYKHDARAISEQQYDEYVNRKIASGYFALNEENECVRKEGINIQSMRMYLEDEYEIAVDYFYDTPELVRAYHVTSLTMFFALLIVIIISSAAIYVLVPLLDKKRRTFGYMIGKLIPVTSDTYNTPSIGAIVLRAFMFVVITYVSALTIYFWLGGIAFATIPLFINTVVLSFTRTNSGLHDFATKINVIKEDGVNSLKSLKTNKEQGGDYNEHIINK